MKRLYADVALVTLVALVFLIGPHTFAITTAGEAPAMTSQDALRLLREGNARYASWKAENPNVSSARLTETAIEGQHPIATVLACSDSRVPVERVFDRGIGDIFVVRVAGNVCGTDEVASLEYGVEHLGTPLLVVLGHTNCGAVYDLASGKVNWLSAHPEEDKLLSTGPPPGLHNDTPREGVAAPAHVGSGANAE